MTSIHHETIYIELSLGVLVLFRCVFDASHLSKSAFICQELKLLDDPIYSIVSINPFLRICFVKIYPGFHLW